jgi:hypothetical protein
MDKSYARFMLRMTIYVVRADLCCVKPFARKNLRKVQVNFNSARTFSPKIIQQPSQSADEKYLKAKGAQDIRRCSVGVFSSTKMADFSNIDFFLHKQSERALQCVRRRRRFARDEVVWRGKATICETSERVHSMPYGTDELYQLALSLSTGKTFITRSTRRSLCHDTNQTMA